MILTFAVIAGAFVGLGLALGVAAVAGSGSLRRMRMASVRVGRTAGRIPWQGVAAGLLAGALVWWASGWPVAGLVAAVVIGALLHARLKAGRPSPIHRVEALEDWVRRLADILRAGHGLEQAIGQSRRVAPAAIVREVAALDGRLRANWSTEQALRAFADDLADVGGIGGDLTVSVLILAARQRGGRLTDVLDGLAASLHDEVDMRRRVEAERAKPRATARLVLILTGVAAAALAILRPGFLQPYNSLTGQLILAVLALAAACLWWWMHALAAGTPEPRFLPAADSPKTHDTAMVDVEREPSR